MTSLPTQDDPPAFGCLVYIANKPTGGVTARVANLEGFQIEASDERSALGKLVPLFRNRVAQMMADNQDVPWIDPPHPIEDNEFKRFLPVHL